jgi:xanthine dehydrogenase YagS FAD-binding subunit
MIDFAYARADSGAAAVAALADDIGGLDELRGITRDGDALHIGALTTLNEIGEHPLVVAHAGALASACLQAASAQIRNRATLGGNVLQRTRCAYFRAEEPVPWPCNRRAPGSGCAARHGLNERHAIFGWTDECVAVQPSDPAVALAALDATVDVVGPDGPRTIPSTEFHLTPQEAGLRENRLNADELIVGYRIPIERGGQAYVKIRERASYEYAIVSAAAAVSRDGVGRVALGSVAGKPWRLPDVADVPLTREALLPVVERGMADASPLARNGFKVTMARNAAVRALLTAGGVR